MEDKAAALFGMQLVITDEAGQAIVPQDMDLEAKRRNAVAFDGFIGNEDAVHALQRSIHAALQRTPVALGKNILLMGPASVGKTELAQRAARALGLPFVQVDGRSVKTREKLFDLIDTALEDEEKEVATPRRKSAGKRSGINVTEYPPFVVFVDEVHLVSTGTQEALLTLLEQRDRTVMLERGGLRSIAHCPHAGFILATTKPSLLDKPVRSRCTEIPLHRYTVDQVVLMLKRRQQQLPADVLELVARCARLTPRRAFELAQDIVDEKQMAGRHNWQDCAKEVLRTRGVVSRNGVTKKDLDYLELLKREGRPLGARVVVSALGLLEADELTEDIEPYLVHDLRFIEYTQKGRMITERGREFVRDLASERR